MPTSARPSRSYTAPSRQGTRALPYKNNGCRAGPMCPAARCTPCKPCHCEPVTDVTGVAIRNTLRCAASARKCRPWLPFFLQRKKGRKERRQNQGFGILSALEVPSASVPFGPANRDVQNLCLAFVWSLRLIPRRALRLCWSGGTGKICASTVGRREDTPPYAMISSFP